jgi:hypothetical protein
VVSECRSPQRRTNMQWNKWSKCNPADYFCIDSGYDKYSISDFDPLRIDCDSQQDI